MQRALAEGGITGTVEAEEPAGSPVEATEPMGRADSSDLSPTLDLSGQLLEDTPSEGEKKAAVAVRIAGREYRIRSGADPGWLRQVARKVDGAMTLIRERTETVDTLEVAVLTALNLAREIVLLREQLAAVEGAETGTSTRDLQVVEPQRLRTLIELVESALEPADRGT